VWEDVGQQLANILQNEVFGCLLDTPSYVMLLEKGGLKPPFTDYTKDYRPPFPSSFKGVCETYASLIKGQIRQLNCLVDDQSLRAEVIHGPVNLYRAMNSRRAPPDRSDLRRGTADIGDWWFDQGLLDSCTERCRAIEQERKNNPLLTEMTPDRCLRTLLRRKLAVSINWNAIGALRRLVLGGNESIPVITGIGLGMPAYSADADASKFKGKLLPAVQQALLPGGERQIWIPFTPQKQIQLWTPKGGFSPNARF
jgi:hypothetical protein